MASTNTTRIVILGGGFGGLATARELERVLPASADVRITLVNRENYFLFTPMLQRRSASIDSTTPVNSFVRDRSFRSGLTMWVRSRSLAATSCNIGVNRK